MGSKNIFSRLKKKGLVLNEAVVLIIGLIMMIVIIFGLLYYTGFLKNFTASMQTLICMMSAHLRGLLIKILWTLIAILIILATISTLSTASKAPQVLGVSTTIPFGMTKGALYFFVISMIAALFSHIPLACSAVNYPMGSFNKPLEENTQLAYFIQDKTTDCWEIYGSGNLDPLWGIDPPNPKICFASNVFLKNSVNMKVLYYEMIERADDWKLAFDRNEDPKIRLFCPNDMGFNPDNWENCIITNKTIYISYKDDHKWSFSAPFGMLYNSFGTGVCGGHITGRKIHEGGDFIVICVDSLVLPTSTLSDLPATSGDGFCHPTLENCETSPLDCPCSYGQRCEGGTCEYCGVEGVYCDPDDDAPCCDELVCDTFSKQCRGSYTECYLMDCEDNIDCCAGYRCLLENPASEFYEKCVPTTQTGVI